ncbi:MAG: hypothetical protein DI586_06805 [Micavibrio aeruginosavorus]|uniref:Prepilin-type N-terminal cleavage/methylation domain-containing protein n=1 Tax=Micavibrio aeruginosavorus TaxID=349221 RepID=A0A2W5FHR8_9BACT|nr:MAG: hypothetical protein DI586_06805 [Micavibrio aeruginosavorus]
MAKRKFCPHSGFTLVELSIVMIIIGLLIGGILKGRELIENARLASVISFQKQIVAAHNTFLDSYNAMPGDIPYATTMIPSCDAASSCVNGNGNLLLGDIGAFPWWDVSSAIDSENTQYWKHLALIGLLGGISPMASQSDWGITHPESEIAGGFFARTAQSRATNGYLQMWKLVLITRVNIDGAWNCGVDVGNLDVCSASPQQAWKIDTKMDDGVANSGVMGAISMGYQTGCGTPGNGINSSNGYATDVTRSSCDLIFGLE